MSKPMILVIDDDPHLVELLKEDLSMLGYPVMTGYDGQMAVQLARTHHPALIIMDVNMPMTNGLKALEFLRKINETKDIPVLILSGAPSGTVYPSLEKSSRVAFIKKPVDLEQLNSIVAHLLGNQ